jgi:hypothetical protein
MAHKMQIELTEAQHKWLEKHAEKKGRKPPDDLVHYWWGRVTALANYADGVESGKKMRPYTPRRLAADERERIVKLAVKEGIAPKSSLEGAAPSPKKAAKAAPKASPKKEVSKAAPPKKRPAKVKPGKQGPRAIEGLDSAEVAKNKARMLHEVDPAKRSYEAILKEAGRGLDGEPLPKVKEEKAS